MSAALYGVATRSGFATFADGARAELYARIARPDVTRFVALGESEYRDVARPGWRAVSSFNLSDDDAGRLPGMVDRFWQGEHLHPDTFTRERDAHLLGAGVAR